MFTEESKTLETAEEAAAKENKEAKKENNEGAQRGNRARRRPRVSLR